MRMLWTQNIHKNSWLPISQLGFCWSLYHIGRSKFSRNRGIPKQIRTKSGIPYLFGQTEYTNNDLIEENTYNQIWHLLSTGKRLKIHRVVYNLTMIPIKHWMLLPMILHINSSLLGLQQDVVPPPRTGADEVQSRLGGLSGGRPAWPWEGLHRNAPSERLRRLGRKYSTSCYWC